MRIFAQTLDKLFQLVSLIFLIKNGFGMSMFLGTYKTSSRQNVMLGRQSKAETEWKSYLTVGGATACRWWSCCGALVELPFAVDEATGGVVVATFFRLPSNVNVVLV
ncbi:Nuclear poly(A) polymerase 3 [Senna tora]|uniref:Nuclear poly(A) polymerase 3 n=1 Tax=Senna tora TaxID=362788 RepID=A0A834X8Z3_9FABA|nr:Nuclear poly(A) polymerase 3 [Senna tora]